MARSTKAKENLKNRIREQIAQAEEEKKKEMFKRRVELARNGLYSYEQHKIGEAVQSFHTYIRVLEEWKKCGEGKLNPSHFDLEKDKAELLLISGVYWDLVKLYDRTKTAEKYQEFRKYLDRFIVFSKGMPYQTVSAETLRKYIGNDKAIHVGDLKEAYKSIAVTRCFIATSLVDHLDEGTIPSLQQFRDEVLSSDRAGRLLIQSYYKISPVIVLLLDCAPQTLRRRIAHLLDKWAARWR